VHRRLQRDDFVFESLSAVAPCLSMSFSQNRFPPPSPRAGFCATCSNGARSARGSSCALTRFPGWHRCSSNRCCLCQLRHQILGAGHPNAGHHVVARSAVSQSNDLPAYGHPVLPGYRRREQRGLSKFALHGVDPLIRELLRAIKASVEQGQGANTKHMPGLVKRAKIFLWHNARAAR
jgi:hypothetical protein